MDRFHVSVAIVGRGEAPFALGATRNCALEAARMPSRMLSVTFRMLFLEQQGRLLT